MLFQYNISADLFLFLFNTSALILFFVIFYHFFHKDEDLIILTKLSIKWFKFFLLLSISCFFTSILIGYLLNDTILRKNLIRMLEIPLFTSVFYVTIILHKYLSKEAENSTGLISEKAAKGFLISMVITIIFFWIIPAIIDILYGSVNEIFAGAIFIGFLISMVILLIYLGVSPDE